MGMGGQHKAPAALPPGKSPGSYCRGCWVAPTAGLDEVWRREDLLKSWRWAANDNCTLYWFNEYIVHNTYSIYGKYSCDWLPLSLSLFVHHNGMSHIKRKSLARSGTRTTDCPGLGASLYQLRYTSLFPQRVGRMCNLWMFNLVVDIITTDLKC
jgi:hypothetical protein